jgi:hypothetical protein
MDGVDVAPTAPHSLSFSLFSLFLFIKFRDGLFSLQRQFDELMEKGLYS